VAETGVACASFPATCCNASAPCVRLLARLIAWYKAWVWTWVCLLDNRHHKRSGACEDAEIVKNTHQITPYGVVGQYLLQRLAYLVIL
jgi:hypothetical protein